MSNTIWAVDGSFFAQRLSGIQRYSIELLAALDRIVPPGFVEIVTPPGIETPHYTNIKVVSFGTHRGGVWQQLDYPRYLRQRGAGGLATCNVIPLFGFRGIAVVHDVCYRARPDFYTDPRSGRSSVTLPSGVKKAPLAKMIFRLFRNSSQNSASLIFVPSNQTGAFMSTDFRFVTGIHLLFRPFQAFFQPVDHAVLLEHIHGFHTNLQLRKG